jgi:hypothetical protein
MYHSAPVLTLLASTLLYGCASSPGASPRSTATPKVGHALVIEPDDLFDTRGNLLRVLSTRLTNSQVVESDGCPALQLRGAKNLMRPSLPGVYVNGLRAGSSCILDMLNTEDIYRVEVYPSGITQRPGYYNHAGGLILVFLKDGSEES